MLKRIPLTLVYGNPDQPRKTFEPVALQELANSILSNGLMQPITVTPRQGEDGETRYMIVMGERRFRAMSLLADQGKLDDATILAHVKRMDEDAVDIQAIVENLARVDVNPTEEAAAFGRLIEKGMTAEELAARLGIQLHRVRERLSLLNLDEQILKLVRTGAIAPTAGVEISKLDKNDQVKVARLIAAGRLRSITDIRKMVNSTLDEGAQEGFGFGEAATSEEVETLSAMERKIDQISAMVGKGFKDGECVVAHKVNPERAALMAEKLRLINQHIKHMIRELDQAHGMAVAATELIEKSA